MGQTSRMTSSALTQTASQPVRALYVLSGRKKMTRPGGTSSSILLLTSMATLYFCTNSILDEPSVGTMPGNTCLRKPVPM